MYTIFPLYEGINSLPRGNKYNTVAAALSLGSKLFFQN